MGDHARRGSGLGRAARFAARPPARRRAFVAKIGRTRPSRRAQGRIRRRISVLACPHRRNVKEYLRARRPSGGVRRTAIARSVVTFKACAFSWFSRLCRLMAFQQKRGSGDLITGAVKCRSSSTYGEGLPSPRSPALRSRRPAANQTATRMRTAALRQAAPPPPRRAPAPFPAAIRGRQEPKQRATIRPATPTSRRATRSRRRRLTNRNRNRSISLRLPQATKRVRTRSSIRIAPNWIPCSGQGPCSLTRPMAMALRRPASKTAADGIRYRSWGAGGGGGGSGGGGSKNPC